MTKNRIRTLTAALAATLALATIGTTGAAAISQDGTYGANGTGGSYQDPTGGGPSVGNTYNCRYWSGGVCVQRSCTAGDGKNCQRFSESCVQQGHTYNGNSQAGTCSRQNLA